MKTLVIGLGNPILGDDGVGWRVADAVQELVSSGTGTARVGDPGPASSAGRTPVEVDRLAVGGLTLMERLVGYDRVIVVDAMATGQHPVGTVVAMPLARLPNRALGHLSSAHDTTLQNALRVGRVAGARLPHDITVVGVEARNLYEFTEVLSAPIAAAVPQAAATVIDLLAPGREQGERPSPDRGRRGARLA
jgi:hydrogenase maturation protease